MENESFLAQFEEETRNWLEQLEEESKSWMKQQWRVPLVWPEHVPRTPEGEQLTLHSETPIKQRVEEAYFLLHGALKALHITKVIFSCDICQSSEGSIFLEQETEGSGGICLEIHNGSNPPFPVCCDKWGHLGDNLWFMAQVTTQMQKLEISAAKMPAVFAFCFEYLPLHDAQADELAQRIGEALKCFKEGAVPDENIRSAPYTPPKPTSLSPAEKELEAAAQQIREVLDGQELTLRKIVEQIGLSDELCRLAIRHLRFTTWELDSDGKRGPTGSRYFLKNSKSHAA